jgi:hypothetical protein
MTRPGLESPDGAHLTLNQGGCVSEERAAQFSRNWEAMLDGG